MSTLQHSSNISSIKNRGQLSTVITEYESDLAAVREELAKREAEERRTASGVPALEELTAKNAALNGHNSHLRQFQYSVVVQRDDHGKQTVRGLLAAGILAPIVELARRVPGHLQGAERGGVHVQARAQDGRGAFGCGPDRAAGGRAARPVDGGCAFVAESASRLFENWSRAKTGEMPFSIAEKRAPEGALFTGRGRFPGQKS